MASYQSPFQSPFAQRVATFSYTLVDEVHSLVDEQTPRRLDPRIKKLGCLGLILFGTLISALGKLAYEIEAVGRDGTSRPFQKPWFLVLLMFIGMSMNLPLSLFLDLVRSSKSRWLGHKRSNAASSRRRPLEQLYTPLLQFDPQGDDEIYPFVTLPAPAAASTIQRSRLLDKQLLLLLVPTAFDLVGSALLNVGLAAVTASAAAMLRQSLLLFAALLGVVVWGKRLNRYHSAGLAGCTAGLMMVAAASLASGFGGSTAPTNRGTMAAGIGLILASQAIAASQLLADQGWSSGKLQLSPLKVVGCEGLLGAVLTLLVVLPAADVSPLGNEGWGLREDSWDSLIMISSRPLLQLLLLVYTGSMQAYNICGMVTAGELSAVDTTLLQAVRTLFVWIINLLIYAAASALAPDAADQLQPIGSHTLLAAAAAAADHPVASADRALGVQGQQQQRHPLPAALHKATKVMLQCLQLHLQQQQQQLQLPPPGHRNVAVHGSINTLSVVGSNSSSFNSSSNSSLSTLSAAGQGSWSGDLIPDGAVATGLLPGEPWLVWSFLQAAGFVVLILAAVTYSKGDNERLRKQLEDEAALIMLDQPPSVAGSIASHPRHFTAHMDIDTAAYLRSFARRDKDALYGITPVPSSSHLAGGGGSASWSLGRQRSGGLAGGEVWEGLAGSSLIESGDTSGVVATADEESCIGGFDVEGATAAAAATATVGAGESSETSDRYSLAIS